MFKYLTKEQQQIHPLFNGKFIENKPIPFPEFNKKYNYSNLFYWAHLEAIQTGEFPLHPHEGFEIMTFVLEGSIEHYDTAINKWIAIEKGGFQVIQSGSGLSHSEKIYKGSKIFQIWFDPDFSKTLKINPNYQDYDSNFIKAKVFNDRTVYEYMGNNTIKYQTNDIEITRELFPKKEYTINIDLNYIYSIYVISGKANINNQISNKDDFIICEDISTLDINVFEPLELFIVKTPKKVSYKTV